ncbi:MAG: glycosyltransferase family 39 protein [Planctomycetes bacterium]|nr:glycosyltransferase family 39 protein [Planctomycetota bacterium]
MDTPSATRRVWPWAFLVVGTIVRLAPLVLPFDFAGPDSVTYLEPARSLAAGLGYTDSSGAPSALRPPGYPSFLALVFALGGGEGAVRLLQALLGGLSAVAIYAIVGKISGREHWARIAGVLAALDPIAVGQAPFLLRESLLSALLVAVVAIRVLLSGRRRAVLTGLVLAALALTHQLYAVLGGFLFLAEACARGRRFSRRDLWAWIGMGLIVILAAGLWARRVQLVTPEGHFSLTSSANAVPARELWLSTACPNLWLNGDPATGFQADAFAEERRLVDRLGVAEAKAVYYARTRANWTAHPLRSLGRLTLMNFWYWAEIPGSIRLAYHPRLYWVRWILLPAHWVRLACALAAIAFLLRTGAWRPYRSALAGLAFLAIAPALLYPVPRYLGPAVPLLDLFAALAVGREWDRRRGLA